MVVSSDAAHNVAASSHQAAAKRARSMPPLQTNAAYIAISHDESKSEFERAWAGASSLELGGSIRTIDGQRTPELAFETVAFGDEQVEVATGIAARAKAAHAQEIVARSIQFQ